MIKSKLYVAISVVLVRTRLQKLISFLKYQNIRSKRILQFKNANKSAIDFYQIFQFPKYSTVRSNHQRILNFPKNGIPSQIQVRNHDTGSNPCLRITSVLATMAGQPAWLKLFRFQNVFTQVGSRVEAVGSAPARKSRTEFMLLFHTHIPGHKKVHIILQAPFKGLVPKYWILFRGL